MILPCFCNYIMDLDGREKTGKVIYTVTYQHYKWSVAPYVNITAPTPNLLHLLLMTWAIKITPYMMMHVMLSQ